MVEGVSADPVAAAILAQNLQPCLILYYVSVVFLNDGSSSGSNYVLQLRRATVSEIIPRCSDHPTYSAQPL